jgi:hypothetical protein
MQTVQITEEKHSFKHTRLIEGRCLLYVTGIKIELLSISELENIYVHKL